MLTKNKGQSILEYAILLAVIIAALLVMQMVIKRGAQGQLKDASGKLGEAYSVSGTNITQSRKLQDDQVIEEEQQTTGVISGLVAKDTKGAAGKVSTNQILDSQATSLTKRTGGRATSDTLTQTDAVKEEKVRVGGHTDTDSTDEEITDMTLTS